MTDRYAPVIPVRMALGAAALEALTAHAVDDFPSECCGVLLGHGGVEVSALEAHRARNENTERAHDRYLLSPADFLRISRDAESRGLEVVGIYHSHPNHPSRPSETDRAAAWVPYVYVIVSVTDSGRGQLQAWVLEEEGGMFAEIPWEKTT